MMIAITSVSTILLLSSLVGIAVNLIALLTVARTKYLYNTFGALCVSLAVSNLGICLIFFFWCSIPPYFSTDLNNSGIMLNERGKSVGQIALLFFYSSGFAHLAVSFNRMMALLYPLRYLAMFDFRKSVMLVQCTWSCAIVGVVPLFWSEECYFFYVCELSLWRFAETECGEFTGYYLDFLPTIGTVICILAMDALALARLRTNNSSVQQVNLSNEMQKRRKREFIFFVQSLCQSVPFLLAVLSFHVVSRYSETDVQLFFSTTFAWISLHTFDGLIIDIFHTRKMVFAMPKKTHSMISSLRPVLSQTTSVAAIA